PRVRARARPTAHPQARGRPRRGRRRGPRVAPGAPRPRPRGALDGSVPPGLRPPSMTAMVRKATTAKKPARPKKSPPRVVEAEVSAVRRAGDDDELAHEPHSMLPVPTERLDDPDELEDIRLSDVNEWGRSEHMREIARRLYDPIYRHWFRVEWEGLEKI